MFNLFKKKGTEDAPSVTPEAPTKKKENFFQKLNGYFSFLF